jgi:hypothetical protein
MELFDIFSIIKPVINTFEQLDVPYYIGGSITSSILWYTAFDVGNNFRSAKLQFCRRRQPSKSAKAALLLPN